MPADNPNRQNGNHVKLPLVELSSVLTKVSEAIAVNPDQLYTEIGVRSHGKGIFHKEPVVGKCLGEKRVFHVQPNCLVLNIVFAWEQAVAATSQREQGMIASHRFPMYQPIENKADLSYLLYFFKSPRGKHLLSLASPGGAGRNRTLGQGDFMDTCIPLPPIAEQRKIASILLLWDRTIELTESLVIAKQRRKTALLRRLLSGIQRMPGFEGDHVVKPLREVALVTMGSSPPSSAYNSEGIGIPLIQGNADITDRVSRPRSWTSVVTKTCEAGDILMSVRAPVGEIAVSDRRACIGRGVCAIRAIAGYDQSFLAQALIGVESLWKRISQGSTFDSVTSEQVKSVQLRFPALAEQRAIADVLNSADKEIALHKTALRSLRRQKKGLMQQLLTGVVRVKVTGASGE